jgi:hemolysin III
MQPTVNAVSTLFQERCQSLGEEIANSVSHGVALIAALIAAPVVIAASIADGPLHMVGASVFSASMVLLYLASTLYHAFPQGRAKRVFQILDHNAIYLLIAGTYTPFALGVLGGAEGWLLFALVWALSILGLVLKSVGRLTHPIASAALYLVMGWLALLAIEPLSLKVPGWGLFWLIAGGLSYTVGVAFFAAERIRYGHFVWHIFVVAGTTCHFNAVLRYAV